MRKALTRIGFVALVVLASVNVVSADPILGPTYPAPGGSTLVTSGGLPGDAGGRTFNFSGLNPAAYTDLYWGVWDTALPASALDGSLDPMSFFSISGNTVTFTGMTQWNDATPPLGGIINVPTRLEITLLSGGTWVQAASVGLSSTLGYVVDVSGTAFSTNIAFTANNTGAGYVPLNSIQQFQSNSNTKASFSGAFYYTAPASVPDPASTLGLFSLALAGLASVRHRRR